MSTCRLLFLPKNVSHISKCNRHYRYIVLLKMLDFEAYLIQQSAFLLCLPLPPHFAVHIVQTDVGNADGLNFALDLRNMNFKSLTLLRKMKDCQLR